MSTHQISASQFIDRPIAEVPRLERMPRRLTPLDEGLASYLASRAGPGVLAFDGDAGSDEIREAIDQGPASDLPSGAASPIRP